MRTIEKHFEHIERTGMVTRSIVIALRKALNRHEREARGYSSSNMSGADITADERDRLLDVILPNKRPLADEQLRQIGIKQLTNPRHKKKLESVSSVVADIREFRLVGFDYVGQYGMHVTPVWRCYGAGDSFAFINVPWQSGGNGPEIVEGLRYA